jgi:hypothetical protein
MSQDNIPSNPIAVITAWMQTQWERIPATPHSQPGSYARGYDGGMVDILRGLKATLDKLPNTPQLPSKECPHAELRKFVDRGVVMWVCVEPRCKFEILASQVNAPETCDVWQPIETAPKGGKWVLLWWPAVTDAAFVGYCVFEHWCDAIHGNRVGSQSEGPTHWQPLPHGPAQKASASHSETHGKSDCDAQCCAENGPIP